MTRRMMSPASLREEMELQRDAYFRNMSAAISTNANAFTPVLPTIAGSQTSTASQNRHVSFDDLQRLETQGLRTNANGFTPVLPPIPRTQSPAALQNRVSFDDLKLVEAQALRQQHLLGQQSLSMDGFFYPSRTVLNGPNLAWNPSPATRQEPTSAPQEESAAPENQRLPAAFLLGLTKMLKNDKNSDIIEWKNGAIHIHQPERLEKEVLNEYFRTAKLESFQRQLHYFGFHKESGYGKFAPCSYTNSKTTSDIKSLLTIKRRTNKANLASKAAKEHPHSAQTVDQNRIRLSPRDSNAAAPLGLPGIFPPGATRSSQEHMRHVEIFKNHQLLRLAQEREAAALRTLAAANRQRVLLEGWFP